MIDKYECMFYTGQYQEGTGIGTVNITGRPVCPECCKFGLCSNEKQRGEIVERIINFYYENNARKLYAVVDRIFNKEYGGTSSWDMDEFYGVATDVFVEIIRSGQFDSIKGNFDAYLYHALRLGIIDEFKRRQCSKRCMKRYETDQNGEKVTDKNGKPRFVIIPDERLDAPVGNDGEYTLGDVIASDFDIHKEALADRQFSERMTKYLDRLSKLQKNVLKLKAAGYHPGEIREELKIGKKQYFDCEKAIHSYRNISVLL